MKRFLDYVWFIFSDNQKDEMIVTLEQTIQKLKNEYENKQKEFENKLYQQESSHNQVLENMKTYFEDIQKEITQLFKVKDTLELKCNIIEKQDKKIMKLLVDINKIESDTEEKILQINKESCRKDDEIQELIKNYDKLKDEYEYILEEYKNIEYKYQCQKAESVKLINCKDEEIYELHGLIEKEKSVLIEKDVQIQDMNENLNTIKLKLDQVENVNKEIIEEYNQMKVNNEILQKEIEELSSSNKKKNKKNKKL
jgi:chromosome segregation ATPase